MINGVLGRSRYLISIETASANPRVLSSLARPRRSQARLSPESKHSARKANTSKIVDLPLPFGPRSTVNGVNSFISTVRSARKFRTFRYSIRGGDVKSDVASVTMEVTGEAVPWSSSTASGHPTLEDSQGRFPQRKLVVCLMFRVVGTLDLQRLVGQALAQRRPPRTRQAGTSAKWVRRRWQLSSETHFSVASFTSAALSGGSARQRDLRMLSSRGADACRCVTTRGHRRQGGVATDQLSHRQNTGHDRAVPLAKNEQFCCPPLGRFRLPRQKASAAGLATAICLLRLEQGCLDRRPGVRVVIRFFGWLGMSGRSDLGCECPVDHLDVCSLAAQEGSYQPHQATGLRIREG